jgi:rhodanese-related sulfurtransferase
MHGTPVRRLLLGLMVAAALATGLVACGSGDDGPGPPAEATLARLDPGQFAARMGGAEAEVINVHIPYEGELEGTDAFIPFDQILGDAQLPADKGSEVLLYCMSGRMSVTAGEALLEDGYTNVSHLEGGMQAWEAAGKPLIQKPQESTGAGH